MQELTPNQREYLDEALGSAWGRIGVGRLVEDMGESMTIYYRKARFECLATDTFWLSETPHVPGSKSWDSACERNCTWGLFRDKRTGRKFRYYNTHLDHISNEARVMGMRVILTEMRRISQGETVFLTGDMKYHDFMGHEHEIVLADMGHYESEQFTKEIFYDIIQKKSPNFAAAFAQEERNPINYIS